MHLNEDLLHKTKASFDSLIHLVFVCVCVPRSQSYKRNLVWNSLTVCYLNLDRNLYFNL